MKLQLLPLLFTLFCVESYRILVFYPLAVKSLNILGRGVVRHLLKDGHEVTFITTHPLNKPHSQNFRQIDISSNIKLFDNDTSLSIAYILENTVKENDVQHLQYLAREIARLTFENENVTKLIEDPNEHFDAVICDYFETEVYAGLSVLYDCPMIWLYSMGAHWQTVRLIADPGNPTYDADYYGTNLPPFTFTQRIEELWARIKWSYFKTFVSLPVEQELYNKTFGPLLAKQGRELPEYEHVIYNASMIFGNEHNAVIYRPSTPQNFKYIGGFHVEDDVIPLPKHLQDLMDNSPHGVIYFSMGSFWKSKALPMKLTKQLLNVFGELKQTVIWKYEDDLTDLPRNVHIVRWAPQQSILAHANCKFFITHGGLLSSIESIHFGVPTIGIPVLYDQFTNINKAVLNGHGIRVDLNHDLPQNLKSAIEVMINDKSYTRKAKELSLIYHDRPTKPGVELVHWVRHVVRTRGALHLRSPALHIPLYQRLYLDLVALVVLFIVIVYLAFIKSPKRSNRKFEKKKKH